MMDIKGVCNRVYKCMVDKGWNIGDPKKENLPRELCLIHSEVSEALEEVRSGQPYKQIYYRNTNPYERVDRDKPEGLPIELADVVIRVANICQWYGIDLEHALSVKMDYNDTRHYQEGGKVF